MELNLKLTQEHKEEKRESEDFKKRRYEQWNENYLLYRDEVKTNRLTQRQSINIPIMRETVQTWISKIDDAPLLNFKSRGRTNKNRTGEIITDELWAYYFDKLKLDILDNTDKKIVGLQGRSFKICGISKGEFFVDIIDPYDIELSPRTNMLDLNSAPYVTRTHIFKPLREILATKNYLAEGKQQLKIYLDTKGGIIKAAETREAYTDKLQRLRDLGAQNFDDYNATETLVEINESYKLIWDVKKNKYVRHLIIFAADNVVLYNKPLKEAIGIDFLPITTWADDPDLNDPWSDGKGDSVRTINKVVNMYISQDVENRAYRNFGMRFFNTMNGTFQPKAFDPKPFGMYGVPGNPKDIIQEMNIPELGDTTNQIGFLKNLIQSSVAQTPTERGESTGSRTTLGEVEINLEQSQGRNTVSSKHYKRCWEEVGEIFYALMSNNPISVISLYKEGLNGDMYKKDIYPSEWIQPEGYHCKVSMASEKTSNDQISLQKAQYAITNFQDNPTALKIAKRKQLEVIGWNQDEIDQSMAFYDQGQPRDAEVEENPVGENKGKPFTNTQVLQQNSA